ncbi:Hypothetical predicted protein [Marmota monax]|uniref:Uncharacterized protein n=1 Tax=Marmota monax TaxID=9995 RepID=A0A5E4ARZ7_MARMO|nr:Hypothetical predicted protein [Marmota monax]
MSSPNGDGTCSFVADPFLPRRRKLKFFGVLTCDKGEKIFGVWFWKMSHGAHYDQSSQVSPGQRQRNTAPRHCSFVSMEEGTQQTYQLPGVSGDDGHNRKAERKRPAGKRYAHFLLSTHDIFPPSLPLLYVCSWDNCSLDCAEAYREQT